jgi:hypothetical protein
LAFLENIGGTRKKYPSVTGRALTEALLAEFRMESFFGYNVAFLVFSRE